MALNSGLGEDIDDWYADQLKDFLEKLDIKAARPECADDWLRRRVGNAVELDEAGNTYGVTVDLADMPIFN